MKIPERKWRRASPSLLLVVVALGLFASPFTTSWAGFRPPWYIPYLLWGGLIALAAFLLHTTTDDDR